MSILKKVKLFETGNFIQGNFPEEKVKAIFENTKEKVNAHFAHTSKTIAAGKVALDLGEFSEFELEDGVITATVEFNEKGSTMLEDQIINGCSVEINDGAISSVAILPVGVKPAITGAEFEETGSLTFGGEFEITEARVIEASEIAPAIAKLDPSDENQMNEFESIRDAVWNKDDQTWVVKRLQDAGYTVEIKKAQEFENATPEQIRAAITLEFEAKTTGNKIFNDLKAEGKITPKMEENGLTAEFMCMLESQEKTGATLEFSDQNFNFAKVFKGLISGLNGKNMRSRTENSEFQEVDSNEKIVRNKEVMSVVEMMNRGK